MTDETFLFSENLCRVCGFESDEKENLFYETLTNDCTAPTSAIMELTETGQMFANCLVLEIGPDDGYPSSICLRCNTQLRMFSEFRRGALRMHDKFTEKLNAYVKTLPQQEVVDDEELKVEKLDIDEERFVEKSLLEILGDGDDNSQMGSNNNEPLLEEDDDVDGNIAIQEYDETIISNQRQEDDEEMSLIHYADTECGEEDHQLPDADEMGDDMETVYLEEDEDDEEDDSAEVGNRLEIENTNDCYLCELCNKNISLRVKNHFCTSDLTFTCKYCKRTFATKQRCEMHESRHTTDRPVGCDKCDKFFKNKYDLKVHHRSHSDARNFICNICGTGFRSSSHLTNHIQSHATTNNFPCTYCDQKYKTKITLLRHISSMHTNKGAFECKVCLKRFGLKFRYQRHLLTHERKNK